jgi:peptide/nickel transport system permease protein
MLLMSKDTISNLTTEEKPTTRSKPKSLFFRLIKEKPLGTFGAFLVLLLLFCGIFANVIAPEGQNQPNPSVRLAAPSRAHIFGTDNIGRDLFSRVIYGARISMVVGLSAALFTMLISVSLGILCGLIGGWFDILVQRFVDAWMCFPGLVLLIVMTTLVGTGIWPVIGILSLSWGISNSRITRGLIISMKENVYIQASTAIGCSRWRIITRHLLPNISPLIIVGFSTLVPELIMAEASLSFLGLGVPPPAPSWGGMLNSASLRYMYDAPWMAIWPGFALALTVYGTNVFGDALRDLLDPRLKGGVGRYENVGIKKKGRKPNLINSR